MNKLYFSFEKIVKYFPQKTAIITLNNKGISFSELNDKVNSIAKEFEKSNLTVGSRVLYQDENTIHFIATLLACSKLDLIFIPLFYRKLKIEVEENKDFIDPAIYFCGKRKKFIMLNTKIAWDSEITGGVILMTSGSTGKTKYIFHPWSHLLNNAEHAAREQKINENSITLMTLSMSHTGGLNMQTLPTLLKGGTLLLLNKYSSIEIKEAIKHKPTHTIIVPAQLQDLKNKKTLENFQFEFILTGSTPIKRSILKDLKKYSKNVISVYGLTEIGPFVSFIKDDDFVESDFCLGEIISDYNWLIEQGEIVLTGKNIGFIVEKENNSLRANKINQVRTGDLGKNKDGKIFFIERKFRTIDISGYKFSPIEVEQVLLKLEGVKEVVVLSKKDKRWGEIPVAFIVGTGLDKKNVQRYAKNNLISYKNPREVYFLDEIPKTSIGKIDYAKLQKEWFL